jgi:hypothetical protein
MLRSRVGFVARLLDGEAMTDVCEFEVSRKKPGDRRLSASFFVAAEFGRVDAARFPVKLEEADDRADADAALHCIALQLPGWWSHPRSSPPLAYAHPPNTACRPPSSRQLESCSRRYGNPRFSLLGKRSSDRERNNSGVLLVMAGSLWIRANLNHNMMPVDQIMQMQR